MICEFLLYLFNSGASTSSINVARSSINFFTLEYFQLTGNPVIVRLFKYFYQERPLRPKYLTFWPVGKLLDYLSSLHPIDSLTLRSLTIKTVALLALATSDRVQTLHLLNIKNMKMVKFVS